MRLKPKRHYSSGASTLEYTIAVAAISLACSVAIEFVGISISNSFGQALTPIVQVVGNGTGPGNGFAGNGGPPPQRPRLPVQSAPSVTAGGGSLGTFEAATNQTMPVGTNWNGEEVTSGSNGWIQF